MRETTALIYSPINNVQYEKLVTLKWGGGVWQMLTSSGGGGGSLNANRGRGVKILLTSYVNAPLRNM